MSDTHHHGHALSPRRTRFRFKVIGPQHEHPFQHRLDRAPVSRGEFDVQEFWDTYVQLLDGRRPFLDDVSYLDYTRDRVPALWETRALHHRGRRRSFQVRAAERLEREHEREKDRAQNERFTRYLSILIKSWTRLTGEDHVPEDLLNGFMKDALQASNDPNWRHDLDVDVDDVYPDAA